VNMLKSRLETAGIAATIRNDSNDSFLQGIPVAVDLYIQQSDLKKAKRIVSGFIRKTKSRQIKGYQFEKHQSLFLRIEICSDL